MKYTIWYYGFISLVIFTLSACVNPNITPAVSSTAVSRLTCEEINLQPVVLGEDGPLTPGSEVILSAQSALPNVTLAWQAESGADYLSVSGDTLTAVYIVPDDRTSDTVTVSVAGLGCPTPLSIDILLPTATLTAVPSATPTPRPSSTPLPSVTPTPSHTPTATATATTTNTAVPTASPTHTATPTRAVAPIRLLEPKNNTCVGGQSTVKFEWESDYIPNNIEDVGGDYFALNIWSNQTEQRSITWIKEPFYLVDDLRDPVVVFTQEVDCTIEGGCFWNVDFIRAKVPKGQGFLPNSHDIIARSPVRNFCVQSSGIINPPIPPTDTPRPKITATWTPPPP